MSSRNKLIHPWLRDFRKDAETIKWGKDNFYNEQPDNHMQKKEAELYFTHIQT